VAFAHTALRDDGKEIDCADEDNIDDKPQSQPVERRTLRIRGRARPTKECESDCEAEQQRYSNENGQTGMWMPNIALPTYS
jgi:hypothetical protein